MAVADRVDALRARHREIDSQIVLEQSRPAPDADMIREMKHRKLGIKDEIGRLTAS